jgi:putative aldouronate transport system substrate-binding protein
MKRQIVLLTVLVCCLLVVLSGCGGKEKKVEAVNASAALPDVEDFSERIQLTWLGSNPALEDNSWGELLFEELFNVDVKIIRATNDEQRTTLFASGEIPDYINIISGIAQLGAYQNQGILSPIPLEEIKKYMPTHYARGTELDPNMFNYSVIGDENWGLPFISVVGAIPRAPAIRADWLEKVGITKVPATIAELEQAFVAFREQDPDGNGRKDTYALSTCSDAAQYRLFFTSIFGAYGVNPFLWREKSDGTLEFGFATDDCKEALQLLAKWYKMELIDPEFVTDLRRSSSRDIPSKFSEGRLGFVDGLNFDDYEWDNDGHLNAKWTTANPSITRWVEEHRDKPDQFSLVNTSDFTNDLPKPYYIIIPKITGPRGKSGYYTQSSLGGYAGFGSSLTNDPAKRRRILAIIEREENEEDIYINHYGPEDVYWVWNEDKTERLYNPQVAQHPLYHPQGQLLGSGFGLWPILNGNKNFLNIMGGPRANQRYLYDYPLFDAFPKLQDKVMVALPAATENPELVSTTIKEYLVKAVRGDVDINATWDSTIAAWKRMGGDDLTKEANDWWASIR